MDAKPHRLTQAGPFLDDIASLHDRVERLRALLDLQRRQVNGMEARLYGPGPAGTAARRLQLLKVSEGR
ncbi:MAG TPA: hypothetical protein VGU45_10605 [Microvirga sp.]|jgi:hypothetical protein|nr:hypothetical protein [Microvirga sp.]